MTVYRQHKGRAQEGAPEPCPAESAVTQKVRVFSGEAEVHAQKVQHGRRQSGLVLVQRDHGNLLSALAGGGFQPAHTVYDCAVRRGHNGQVHMQPGQHPAHIGGVPDKTEHVVPGQGQHVPHIGGHAGIKGRVVNGNVGQLVGQGAHVRAGQRLAHILLGVLHGNVVGGPVEQNVDAPALGFRHVHAHHRHPGGPHVHGLLVALMAGQDFPVQRGHQGQEKAQLAQGQPHQFQALGVGLAGIVKGRTQGGHRHKLNAVHSRASAGFPP